MSGSLRQIASTLAATNQLARQEAGLVSDVGRLGQSLGLSGIADGSGLSWASGAWFQQLQPGSWRGVPFVLDAGETAAGRRIALHEFPYSSAGVVWAEDLGKLPRRFQIQAFAVGDDCYQLRDAMLRACEQGGAGTLVHPTLGAIQCVLLEFSTADRRERGRVVEFQFTFIVAADVRYPATTIATGQIIGQAAAALRSASAGNLSASLFSIGSIAKTATASVVGFTALASRAVGDAANIFNAVRGLQGFYGRYSTGSRATLHPVTATVSGLLRGVTTARSVVRSAADLVMTTARLL